MNLVQRSIGLGALLTTILVSCAEKEAAIEPRKGSFSKAKAARSAVPDRVLDDQSLKNMAILLAGQVNDEGAADPLWLGHAREMKTIFAVVDPRHAEMRSWAAREVDPLVPREVVFYPFGGPDLFSILTIFPKASSYVLVGLEAPGRLPLPEAFEAAALARDLERLRQPFQSLQTSGYFIRSEIDKQLAGGQFDGILPILLISLTRAGQQPVALQFLSFDPRTGQVGSVERGDAQTENGEASGVRIVFRESGDGAGTERSVYYFAQDLSNDGIFPDAPFVRWLEQQGPTDSFIKVGEYLLHTDAFSNLRAWILERSELVLQDDSAIPLRFFTSDQWRLNFFGEYRDIIGAYKQWFQPDLEAVFKRGRDVKPLGWSAGYSANLDGGCLILAERSARPKR
jgi:hypothetical protein